MTYRYDEHDQQLVDQRAAQFRGQTRRFLEGRLSEEQFRPLRLQNGLYIQRHAPMLRIAIPYGVLDSRQLRMLARISRDYDRGYGHFTTRQCLQLNWPPLERVPDILADLAGVQMHAIQTSGNCIRNITTDALAGVAPDEIVDPRPLCELLRQWSTFHPEFAWLPRKFKIAVSGAHEDRAATAFHDIGLRLHRQGGQTVLRVMVGGGMGRTPILGETIHDALPWPEMLNYVEAIMRVYNRFGRRDNLYKARIKILVKAIGAAEFKRQVDEEWSNLAGGPHTIPQGEFDRVASCFASRAYDDRTSADSGRTEARAALDDAFALWLRRNLLPHRQAGYTAVTLSLKAPDAPPGDATADQMDAVAALADEFSGGEIRVSHRQNLVLPDVRRDDLYALWQAAKRAGVATANVGLASDIICCPGGDFCSLANAKSIPIARAVQQRLAERGTLEDLGDLVINISGCMNSCGHHHAGHIGILGVDKAGAEFYQISLGGNSGQQVGTLDAPRIGTALGKAFSAHEVPSVIDRLVHTFQAERQGDETFLETVTRVGNAPFKAAIYPVGPSGRSLRDPEIADV